MYAVVQASLDTFLDEVVAMRQTNESMDVATYMAERIHRRRISSFGLASLMAIALVRLADETKGGGGS